MAAPYRLEINDSVIPDYACPPRMVVIYPPQDGLTLNRRGIYPAFPDAKLTWPEGITDQAANYWYSLAGTTGAVLTQVMLPDPKRGVTVNKGGTDYYYHNEWDSGMLFPSEQDEGNYVVPAILTDSGGTTDVLAEMGTTTIYIRWLGGSFS